MNAFTAPLPGAKAVLLVEDEPGVRMVTEQMLRRLGFVVHVAEGGEKALDLARRLPGSLALLLTDVVMPGMNGRELAERLCRERPEVKVLYTSAHSRELISQGGILIPGTHFLSKPYTVNLLEAKIREVLTGPA